MVIYELKEGFNSDEEALATLNSSARTFTLSDTFKSDEEALAVLNNQNRTFSLQGRFESDEDALKALNSLAPQYDIVRGKLYTPDVKASQFLNQKPELPFETLTGQSLPDYQEPKPPKQFVPSDTKVEVKTDDSILGTITRPFKAQAYKIAEAVNKGIAGFGSEIADIEDYIGKKIGSNNILRTSSKFREGLNFYLENADYLNRKAQEVGANGVDEIVGEAIGGAVPGISQFMFDVYGGAAFKGAAQAQGGNLSELWGALSEQAKTLLIKKSLDTTAYLKLPYKVPATAGIFAAQTAGQGGTPEEIAKSAGVGALYGVMAPGKVGAKELKQAIKDVPEFITNADWYRNLTIKERALVPLTIEELKASGWTDAQLARQNPEYFTQLLKERMPAEESSLKAGLPIVKESDLKEVISSEGKGQEGYAENAEGQVQDVVSPQKPSVTAEAQKQAASPLNIRTINDWVISKGSISMAQEHWKGELKDVRDYLNKGKKIGKGSRVIKGVSGLPLDQMALMAKDEGWIEEATPQTLLDAMYKNIPNPTLAEDRIASKQELYPDSLEIGQKVVIDGDKYEMKGIDDKGAVVLEDGEIRRVDPWEPLIVDKALPAGKGPIAQRLSKALGKDNQLSVLEKMGIKNEDEQIKQIVKDALVQKVETALAFESKGKVMNMEDVLNEAFDNADKLLHATGDIRVAREIDSALAAIGKVETKLVPLKSMSDVIEHIEKQPLFPRKVFVADRDVIKQAVLHAQKDAPEQQRGYLYRAVYTKDFDFKPGFIQPNPNNLHGASNAPKGVLASWWTTNLPETLAIGEHKSGRGKVEIVAISLDALKRFPKTYVQNADQMGSMENFWVGLPGNVPVSAITARFPLTDINESAINKLGGKTTNEDIVRILREREVDKSSEGVGRVPPDDKSSAGELQLSPRSGEKPRVQQPESGRAESGKEGMAGILDEAHDDGSGRVLEKLNKVSDKLSEVADKLANQTESFLKVQEQKPDKTKAVQKDMLGAAGDESLSRPVTAAELSETPIEKATKEAEARKESEGKQGGLSLERGKKGLKVSDAEVADIISEIERIAAPGTRVEAKEKITVDPEALSAALEKWGEGELGEDIVIRGSHRAVRLDGNQFTSLIELSLGNMDPKITPSHEAFHSVEELLLTNEERQRLEERFPERDGILSNELQATAFAQYVKGRKSFPVWVREIFDRIKRFVDRLGNFVKGKGYQSAYDIFHEAYTGELRQRAEDLRFTTQDSISLDVMKSGDKEKQSGKVLFPHEIENRYQSSKGVKTEGFWPRIKNTIVSAWEKSTRVYEHLPNKAEFAPLKNALLKLSKQKGVASDTTLRAMHDITVNLDRDNFDLFTRKVIVDDLHATAEKGKDLPFGFTPESLAEAKARVDAAVSANKQVQDALTKRNSLWAFVKNDYISAMKDIGFDPSDKLNNENYFRHQVLEYANAKGAGLIGTGNRLRTPSSRGFLRKREGSALDINSDYIQAEHEVMAQMIYDVSVAKTIGAVDRQYNIVDTVKAGAKEHEIDDWHKAIPEGYVTWQPREGHAFFMVDAIPATLARQLHEGALKEFGITESILKRYLAVGGPRREFVVKDEIAQALDNLNELRPDSAFLNIDRALLKGWKVWTLISPRRLFKYNIRNLTGDADAVMVGNPSSFRKVPQAVKELYDVMSHEKEMSGSMRDWFERGGMGSTLQAQEMGDLNKLKMFEKLHEAQGTVKELPLKAWQKYWKTARLTTDFREAILRYASYLDYLEQMNSNPEGKPKNFGASIKEEVMALNDVKDRAYWLSNDLLGAYDKVSVTGQKLREYIYPFWSWKEVNFKRYIQFAKNASEDGRLAGFVGRKALGTMAKSPFLVAQIGKFLLKATALWAILQVWNNSRFPDEEKELPEEERSRPHIIFGRDDDGNIIYFNRIGALGDFLQWFGLDAAPKQVDDWMKGKKTLKEIGIDMVKSPANVVISGLSPFIKTPFEIISRRSMFPDVFKPGTIRDRGLAISRTLGLENEYIAVMGLPSRGYQQTLSSFFIYKSDPLQTAYAQMQDDKARFLNKIGKGSEGFWITPKGNAVYNFKRALRYQDKEAAQKYLAEFISMGGTGRGLGRSLRSMNPLSGLSQKDRALFLNSLDSEGKDNLQKAIKFYQQTLLGAKQDGVSNEE